MARIDLVDLVKPRLAKTRKVISVRDALRIVEKSKIPIRSFFYRDNRGFMTRVTFRNGVIVMEQKA